MLQNTKNMFLVIHKALKYVNIALTMLVTNLFASYSCFSKWSKKVCPIRNSEQNALLHFSDYCFFSNSLCEKESFTSCWSKTDIIIIFFALKLFLEAKIWKWIELVPLECPIRNATILASILLLKQINEYAIRNLGAYYYYHILPSKGNGCQSCYAAKDTHVPYITNVPYVTLFFYGFAAPFK